MERIEAERELARMGHRLGPEYLLRDDDQVYTSRDCIVSGCNARLDVAVRAGQLKVWVNGYAEHRCPANPSTIMHATQLIGPPRSPQRRRL